MCVLFACVAVVFFLLTYLRVFYLRVLFVCVCFVVCGSSFALLRMLLCSLTCLFSVFLVVFVGVCSFVF